MSSVSTTQPEQLSKIISEYGIPVFVRKERWTNGFILRVDSVEDGMAKGTAFRDGAEYRRASGAYSYRVTDEFYYLGTSLSVSMSVDSVFDSPIENDTSILSAENEEISAEETESKEFLSHFSISDVRNLSGQVSERRFRPLSSFLNAKESGDMRSEEKQHLTRLVGIIRNLIVKILDMIQHPQRPGWESTSQYKGAPLNSEMAEFYGIVAANNDLMQDADSLRDIEDHPYFSHISLIFEDEAEADDVFVGERLVYDEGWPQIVSWQSPLGGLAYDNEKTSIKINDRCSADIQFKRKVVIKNKQIKEIVETYNRGSRLTKEEEAMVFDEFLVKVMQEKRSHKELTNIIPSIQSNQNQIIRAPISENYIVQGCAGCGKTMILLHRISYLLYNNPGLSQKNFLMLAPSRRFEEHIDPLVRNLRITGITISTLSDYYVEYLCSVFPGWSELKDDERLFGESGRSLQYSEYFYSEEYARKLRERVDRRMQSLRENENEIIHQAGERAERKRKNLSSFAIAEIEGKIDSLKRKRRISIFDEEFADIIPQGMNVGKRKRPICKSELYATALLNFFCYGNRNRFPFVFVDEGQDIATQEFVLLRAMNTNAVFNIYGDIDQQIYDYTRRSSWDDLRAAGDFTKYSIGENYRNTIQITDFINYELMMDMTALGLDGRKVSRIPVEGINAVRKMAEKDDRIAVIYASDRDADSLPEEVLADESFTVKDIKGMEFETVIVLPNGMNDSELYIAYSRALDNLYICDS